jgi:hypothetical protein
MTLITWFERWLREEKKKMDIVKEIYFICL